MRRILFEDFQIIGCFGIARLIVESNPEGRIYQVDSTTDIEDEEPVTHAYVLIGDIVLNQDGDNLTADEIRTKGVDVTSKILRLPWRRL